MGSLMAEVCRIRGHETRNSDELERENANVREQDRLMPIANVIRIMRKVLPAHAKIADDAKETIQECVSEFISFITSEANDRCQREQRKTITAEDVLWAMSKLGFDDYVEPLSFYLQKYREMEGDHKGSIRGEPLPRKDHNAFALPSPSYHVTPPGLHNSAMGYYRDFATGPSMPFDLFSPYK